MTNRPTHSIAVAIALGLLVLCAVCSSQLVPNAEAGHGYAREKKIATQLLERHAIRSSDEETAEVIIQLRGRITGLLRGFLSSHGIQLTKEFKNLDSAMVRVPIRLLPELAKFEEVHFITGDEEVISFGHVSSTTGADDVTATTTSGDAIDGSGIGIAIVDSGIYSQHKSFNGRVVFTQLEISVQW